LKVKTVSPRAELLVLRGMTHKNRVIAGTLLSSVDEAYFDAPESREVLASIRRQMSQTGEPPIYKLVISDPEISEEARAFFRDSEAGIQSKEAAAKAVQILNRYRKNRALHDMMVSIDTAMQSGKCDTEAMLEECSRRISQARMSKAKNNEFVHFGLNNNSMGIVKDLLYGDKSEDVIPTLIRPFDEKAGGLLRGGLVTVGASSGGGKSLLACQLAINFAIQGYKVVIVPLEMTKAEMIARIGANLNKVDVTRILTGKLTEAEKDAAFLRFKKFMRHIKRKGGRLSIYKPEEDVTMEDVLAAVNAYDADVRIVDYISLLKGADGDDSWQALGAIARLAKVNASATKTINILLCQVNEDGKIRYARAISEHSNNSFIWVTKKEEREKEVGVIKVEQPKARNSASYPFEIGFHWAWMKVVDVESVPDTSSDSKEHMTNLADV
jgi:replicative DNA helicase